MVTRSEPDITLHGLGGQVDNCFMEFVLQGELVHRLISPPAQQAYRAPDIVAYKALSVNGLRRPSTVFCIEKGDYVFLFWFMKANVLKMERNVRRPCSLNQCSGI